MWPEAAASAFSIQFRQRFAMAIETATSCLYTPFLIVAIVAVVAISFLSDGEIDVPQNEKSGENP
jgi:hypothetical protein